MSSLPQFIPSDVLFARWVRAVRDLLVADEVVRVERIYDGDDAPIDVVTGLRDRPRSVQCVAATQVDAPSETESGARVVWEWIGGVDGVVRISAIDLTSATAEYSITIEVR
jgi:hypothetical protein